MTVVVEEEVVVVEEEEEVVAEAAAAAAAAEAAAGPAAEAEVAEAEMMTMMTRMTRMTTVHLPFDQVHPVDYELDGGFLTIKKWNSNWSKSCKINARWLRDDESLASRPPILSQTRIRMDDALP